MPNHSDAISVPQRFHFNVGNGIDIVVDRNGVLLADIGDAIAQALIVLRRNVRPLTAWYPAAKIWKSLTPGGELLAPVPIH
jgi:hypothetical protein